MSFSIHFSRSQMYGTHSMGPKEYLRFLGIHPWNSNDECTKSESNFSGFCGKVSHHFFDGTDTPASFKGSFIGVLWAEADTPIFRQG